MHFYNGYTLNSARIHDILKLCEYRGYDLEGYRETILFLYRYFNCIDLDDEEKALEEAIELNERFLKPLREKEVVEATQSAENYYKEHKYNYTNAKLIEILDITEEEQKSLTTIISRKEKYSRNNEKRRAARRDDDGLTKRQREKYSKT